jgi:hypothetical protein
MSVDSARGRLVSISTADTHGGYGSHLGFGFHQLYQEGFDRLA